MSAGVLDITIERGSDWEIVLQLKDALGADFSLTGFAAYSQIRKKASSTAVLIQVTCTISADPTDGQITLSIPAATSSAVTEASGVYDVEIVSNDVVPLTTRILKGKVTFDPEVTRTVIP